MAFYAGFDIRDCPSPEMMDWLHANTNLVWCGYYLAPAPNRPPSGWPGRYASLSADWGLLPIYVGQQDPATGNSETTLTAAQGKADATDAANLAAADRFPAQTCVYLDWESGDLNAAGATAYIQAWIAELVADGRYRPGIYCSHLIAAVVASDIIRPIKPAPPQVRFWCWKVPDTAAHAFAGDIAAIPELDPGGSGFPDAVSWQRDNNAVVTFPAAAPTRRLQVDFSTSSMANPGAPGP